MGLAPTYKRTALIVVDVQNDFLPGGALAVPEGDEVIEPLQAASKMVDFVVASADWHPADTAHFDAWPVHCVAGTEGAEIHPEAKRLADAIVLKGTGNLDDGYSALEGKTVEGVGLSELLAEQGITRLIVGGLATDYCVKATVLDARKSGYEVLLLTDAIRAVDLAEGDGQKALDEMLAAGAKAITTVELAKEIEEVDHEIEW